MGLVDAEEKLDIQDLREILGSQDHQGPMVNRVLKVPRAHLALQEPRDLRGLMAKTAFQVRLESEVHR